MMSINASNADIHMEESKGFHPPETMTALAWKRFRRHPGALVGSVVLLMIVLSIAFAFLSPYDPEKSDIANRYRVLVEKSVIDLEPGYINVTISVGATMGLKADTVDTLLVRADRAMYQSKADGKNRVTPV